jgi:hypothetical protein
MKVNGIEIPEKAIFAAECCRDKAEFDAQAIRCAIMDPILQANIATRRESYDIVDYAATRLISQWAKQGLIKKVAGTRRWEAA